MQLIEQFSLLRKSAKCQNFTNLLLLLASTVAADESQNTVFSLITPQVSNSSTVLGNVREEE